MLFSGAAEGRRATVSAPAVLFAPLTHDMLPAREPDTCFAAVYVLLVGCRGCSRLFGARLVLLCIECFAVYVTYLELGDGISRLLRLVWPIYLLGDACG